jgi:hypothetical protein
MGPLLLYNVICAIQRAWKIKVQVERTIEPYDWGLGEGQMTCSRTILSQGRIGIELLGEWLRRPKAEAYDSH